MYKKVYFYFIFFIVFSLTVSFINASERIDNFYKKELSYIVANAIKDSNVKIVMAHPVNFQVLRSKLISKESHFSQNEKNKIIKVYSSISVDLLDLVGKPIRGEVSNDFYVLKTVSTANYSFSPFNPNLVNKWLLFIESPLNINHQNFIETQDYLKEVNLSNELDTSNYFQVYSSGYAAVCIDCDLLDNGRPIPVASEKFVSDIKILSDSFSKFGKNENLKVVKETIQSKLQTELGLMVLNELTK